MNRCSRVDTSFPFLPRAWSVDIWDDQYRAVWPGGSMARSPPGNEGWSGREGQPPGSSVTKERLTPAEGSPDIWRMIGWAEETAWISHPTSVPRGMSRRRIGEAIVVVAVGSAAAWFLTGWVEGVRVDFMIDTGCQVTILATSVFERMRVYDPRVRSRLRPCGRCLVSADSAPLTVRGELDMTYTGGGK